MAPRCFRRRRQIIPNAILGVLWSKMIPRTSSRSSESKMAQSIACSRFKKRRKVPNMDRFGLRLFFIRLFFLDRVFGFRGHLGFLKDLGHLLKGSLRSFLRIPPKGLRLFFIRLCFLSLGFDLQKWPPPFFSAFFFLLHAVQHRPKSRFPAPETSESDLSGNDRICQDDRRKMQRFENAVFAGNWGRSRFSEIW